jgi:hypothetical protein
MRFIPTLMHGVMDYLVGILLLIAPWLLDFQRGGAETTVPMVLGGAALLYSMVTNYELGLIKLLPMKVHLIMDILSGIILVISPWLWRFDKMVYMPHLTIGLVEILAALTTSKQTKLITKSTVKCSL